MNRLEQKEGTFNLKISIHLSNLTQSTMKELSIQQIPYRKIKSIFMRIIKKKENSRRMEEALNSHKLNSRSLMLKISMYSKRRKLIIC